MDREAREADESRRDQKYRIIELVLVMMICAGLVALFILRI